MADDNKNHEGSGDPGGVDQGMPVPGPGGGESKADVEAAFGGSSDASSGSASASSGGAPASSGSAPAGKVDQLVAKAGEMKDRASALSGEITSIEKEGAAAGGMVRATLDGAGNLKKISIDPSLMDGEPAVLEELVVNAVKHAKEQVAEEAAGKVSELVGGLPIPASVAGLISQFLPKK